MDYFVSFHFFYLNLKFNNEYEFYLDLNHLLKILINLYKLKYFYKNCIQKNYRDFRFLYSFFVFRQYLRFLRSFFNRFNKIAFGILLQTNIEILIN